MESLSETECVENEGGASDGNQKKENDDGMGKMGEMEREKWQ